MSEAIKMKQKDPTAVDRVGLHAVISDIVNTSVINHKDGFNITYDGGPCIRVEHKTRGVYFVPVTNAKYVRMK